MTDQHIIMLSKSTSLKLQSSSLFKTEHQVHVLYCLSRGTLHQIVNDGGDMDVSIVKLDMQQPLIVIDHFFQTDAFIGDKDKG